MAYFFNNLTELENEKLQGWMNAFEISTLTNKNFRKKISVALN